MGDKSPQPVSAPTGAVFLSYASQDAKPARKICDTLRAGGIEVWFDQSELRGGDAWDQKIRRQIHDCALFIPIISSNTASRHEGYFRLEWDLADQRTHMIARNRPFIVPVCLDAIPDAGADVPDSFHGVQWTRLPGGKAPREFVARIKRLLSSEPPTIVRLPAEVASGSSPTPPTTGRSLPVRGALPVAVAALVLAALAYLLINKPWTSKPAGPQATSNTTSSSGAPPAAAFNPPPHSIAVLPFVNMSGDKEQEYFSDGLSEELINSLSRIEDLQVAARTSTFSFKGKDTDIATIARKLNVATVLEGSVRRSAHAVRVTAQLDSAVSGFHIWSQTFDRDWGDVLKLQRELANAVAGALLKVAVLNPAQSIRGTTAGVQHLMEFDVATRIELGSTHNPAAFDAYLRGLKAFRTQTDAKGRETAIAAYTEAIRLDPTYALAYAGRSLAYSGYAEEFATGASIRDSFDKAQADARHAITLAPELAEGHLALGHFLEVGSLDFRQANEAYERASALAPGSAAVLDSYGTFAAYMGRHDAGIAAVRRAVALDPLNPTIRRHLGNALMAARRYGEATEAYREALSLDPNSASYRGFLGNSYYAVGDYQSAQASCESNPKQNVWIALCLAVTYDKLGRHADAEAELAKAKALMGDAEAFQYAEVYAQWGDRPKALEWLDTAMRLRDPGLGELKTDPYLDPLRHEPHFQSIERELKFPQ